MTDPRRPRGGRARQGSRPAGAVRIVAGLARGRRLAVPPGRAVRPTPDRVREALFSILGARCEGARVLDACAGTGALGLEALSRGAASALLVEVDRALSGTLSHNVEASGLEGAQVLFGDTLALAPRLVALGHGPFDLVFIDPPFDLDLGGALATALARGGALAPDALVVIEHPAGKSPSPEGLDIVDERHYGSVALTFCESEP